MIMSYNSVWCQTRLSSFIRVFAIELQLVIIEVVHLNPHLTGKQQNIFTLQTGLRSVRLLGFLARATKGTLL